jgi:hypothetical protein
MSNWMKLRTWFRGRAACARSAAARSAAARAGRAPRVRLRLESLEERLAPAVNSDFRGIIGLDAVQANYPYLGQGYSVAVLDTGINYNDPYLGGGWGKRVIAGWNFVANNDNPMDDNGHGTFVAGEIGSSNPAYPGVAPDVNLIALKVLDANNNGTWANIDAGLKWVIAHQAQYNIVAVNLSLGSGNYTTDSFNILESDLATLKQDGVFISVASGNNFGTYNSAPGLAYPAVDPDVVSVGATWAGSYGSVSFFGVTDSNTAPNEIAGFTQRDAALSLLAPGAWITSEALAGGTTQYGGTSMAAAVVTGSAVIIHQALDTANQSSAATESGILSIMQSTGTPIKDNNAASTGTPTGLTFRQLNLKAAVDSIASLPASVSGPLTLAPIANQTIAPGGSTTVSLSTSAANGAAYTLTPQLVNLPALAYQLHQQLGLSYTGSYYLNKDGMNEKWLLDRNRNWYFILPDGEFRRWAGTNAASMQASNLVAMFDPTYYANPMQLWYTPYVAFQPISLTITGNTLAIKATSPTWTGQVPVRVMASNGVSEVTQTFNLSVAAPAAAVASPPVLGALPNLTVAHSQNPLLVALSATDPAGRPMTFAAQVLATNGTTPPVTATVTGNQLSLSPAASFAGTYSVVVTVSDGVLSSSAKFMVTVTDTPPQLAAIAPQTMTTGQNSLTVPLSGSDADGDSLTYTATVLTPSAALYQLSQQLGGLHPYNGSYYTNEWGLGEKWLVSSNGTWYGLFPNGNLYRWAGLITTTMTSANLVATLDPSVYTYPPLLWNAQPAVAPPLTLSVQGNQLVVQRPAGLTGVFQVQVAVSDGVSSATQTFYLTLS